MLVIILNLMKVLIYTFVFTIFPIVNTFPQNLISNPDFENSGQLDCQSWFDMCGYELTYLCDTVTPDTTCYAKFYQYPPPGGRICCIGVTGEGNNPASLQTLILPGKVALIFMNLKSG